MTPTMFFNFSSVLPSVSGAYIPFFLPVSCLDRNFPKQHSSCLIELYLRTSWDDSIFYLSPISCTLYYSAALLYFSFSHLYVLCCPRVSRGQRRSSGLSFYYNSSFMWALSLTLSKHTSIQCTSTVDNLLLSGSIVISHLHVYEYNTQSHSFEHLLTVFDSW